MGLEIARKNNETDVENQIKLLQDLILNEMIEVMAPLAYLICFMVAYYGPNAGLIGNIRNSYWQYKAVEDVAHTIQFVLMFLLIDFSSALIGYFLLWKVYRINLYRAYIVIQNEFGFPFLLRVVGNVTTVR